MIYEIDYDVPSDRVLLDGGALRYARKSRNMTAKDLADAAKISSAWPRPTRTSQGRTCREI